MNAHKDAISVIGTTSSQNKGKSQEIGRVSDSATKKNNNDEICETSIGGQQLTQEEYIEIGSSGWELYLDYIIISKGMLLQVLSLIALLGFAAFSAGASYWIALSSEFPSITKGWMVGFYTAMSIVSAIFAYSRSLLVAHLGLKASKEFFSGFTSSIFNAPMSFFDSTPVGRILTRVSCIVHICLLD